MQIVFFYAYFLPKNEIIQTETFQPLIIVFITTIILKVFTKIQWTMDLWTNINLWLDTRV